MCTIVGISYRQLDYWARTDLVRPSIADAAGSGTQRTYSYRDLVRLKVVKSLLDAGVKLQTARKAIEYLREDLGDDWATASLVLDGTNSVLARTDDASIDLVRHGQGVLNIVPLGHMVEEVDAGVREHVGQAARRRRELIIAELLPHEEVRFAHNSERQFAKLLDFYAIEWEYEPRTFVLERDREGNPAQAFTPDFYLPTYDLYIEITTLNQKLVTKKNRKARRLVELFPDVSVKVFYQRDYLQLLVKYGLEPPSQLAAAGIEPGDAAPARPVSRAEVELHGTIHAPRAHRRVRVTESLRHSPIDARHRALGARMAEFGGWEMPIQYTGVLEEHRACREHAVVFDVSHLGSVRVHGSGAFATLQWAFTNDLDRIGPGRAQYTHLLDPDDAHVVDDIIVWWVAPGDFLVMPNASNTIPLVAALDEAASVFGGGECTIEDVTESRAVLAVQGPAARVGVRRRSRQRGRRLRASTLPRLNSAKPRTAGWPAPATPARTAWNCTCPRRRRESVGTRCSAPASCLPVWARVTPCGSRPACHSMAMSSARGSHRSKPASAGWSGSTRETSAASKRSPRNGTVG